MEARTGRVAVVPRDWFLPWDFATSLASIGSGLLPWSARPKGPRSRLRPSGAGLRPELSLWEIGLRGSVAWPGLVLVIRVVPKRNTQNTEHISPNDMLVLAVIGTLAADAVSGGSTATGNLFLMIVVVLLWSYILDILEYRVPAFRRLMRPPQTLLVEKGGLLPPNMQRELVTKEEIMATLRKEGIRDLSDVASHLEGNGEISVLK